MSDLKQAVLRLLRRSTGSPASPEAYRAYITQLIDQAYTPSHVARLAGEQRPDALLVMVAWGEPYIDTFIRVGLPMLLHPTNIPAMAQGKRLLLRVFTDKPSRRKLERAALVRELRKHVNISYEPIPRRLLERPQVSTWSHKEIIARLFGGLTHVGINEAVALGTDLVFIWPDQILGPGSFAYVRQLMDRADCDCMVVRGLNVNRTGFVDELASYRTADGLLALTSERLVEVVSRHIRDESRRFLLRGADMSVLRDVNYIIVPRADGMTFRQANPDPVYVSRRVLKRDLDYDFNPPDGRLLSLLFPTAASWDRIDLPARSQDYFACDISDVNSPGLDEWPHGPALACLQANFRERWNPMQRHLFRRKTTWTADRPLALPGASESSGLEAAVDHVLEGGAAVLLLEPPDDFLGQRVEALRIRRGKLDKTDFFSPADTLEAHRSKLGGVEIRPLPKDIAGYDEVFVTAKYSLDPGDVTRWPAIDKPNRIYLLGTEGAINLYRAAGEQRSVDATEYPFLDSHVFSQRAERPYAENARCYVFFPYGYLFRFLGIGPIDPFGFRIDRDLTALQSRAPDHKLIAVFGGSSTFSIHCLHHQMFTSVMEERLNASARGRASSLSFTVLNFGQNSHVVLNQLLTYRLFCEHLRPDIVISHDGHNDLFYGQTNDPFLVERNISYQNEMEQWSGILYRTPIEAPSPAPILNPPDRVIGAYMERKRQFAQAVIRAGSAFVWGLQPLIWSKRGMTTAEVAGEKIETTKPRYGQAFRNLPRLYELLAKQPTPPDVTVADLHHHFASAPVDRTLFSDHVHLRPDGDAVIGEFYARLVLDMIPDARL